MATLQITCICSLRTSGQNWQHHTVKPLSRFCMVYHMLNGLPYKHTHISSSRRDFMLDLLSGSRWSSTLDMNRRYWQKAKAKIGVHCRERALAFQGGAIFGLCDVPATFQCLMKAFLAQLPLFMLLTLIP